MIQPRAYLQSKNGFDALIQQEQQPPRRRACTRHTSVILALFSALAFFLGACTSVSADNLSGTTWELTSLSGSELLPDTTITLDFAENELTGSAGCNHYGGSFAISGQSLTVNDLFATEMGCPEPPGVLEQEQAYLAALRAAASYRLAGDRLEIVDEAGQPLLVFVAPAGNDPSPAASAAAQSDGSVAVTREPAPEAAVEATLVPDKPGATPALTPAPPPGFEAYEDPTAGVSLLLPTGWTATHVVPGQSAILQSYPEDKYVGGEARDPVDTKCDLTIRPPDVDVAGQMEAVRSDPTVIIVSETETVLQSGEPGVRLELESLGPSRSLVTEVHDRVVVLSCFGNLAPFDDLAASVRASDTS